MSKRLEIARELLKEDGVIFISIDDNEQAQLKLLCDEIFGEQNLVSILCVELSKTQGMKVKSAQEGRIVKNHEYIYIYAKNINKVYVSRKPLLDNADIWDSHYSKVLLKKEDIFSLMSINDYIKEKHKDIYIEFESNGFLDKNQINEKSIRIGILINDKIRKFLYEEIADKIVREMACSISIPEEIKNKLKSNKIVEYKKYFLTYTGNGKLRQYRTLSENINESDEYNRVLGRVTIRGALWKGFYSDMMNIQKEGMIDFKNGKKPIRLISQLNKWCNRPNSIILDFFAGSATTGHAVMQLNKEDGGNRKYILCTNNENNICENITYQRLKNIQTELPHNLKYFKTDFVAKYSQHQDDEIIFRKIFNYIKELIELEHHIQIDDKKYIILKEEEKILEAINKIEKGGKLFIRSGILLSTEEQFNLEQKQVKVIEIPEYYFKEELKEVGELW
ncbi:Adenine specific DNA methylase Mod [Mycoplasmopsis citelli]|uniref:Adenine specific DNA methylase Mod n=2 Tax=Mycoplasmopsis citelli TaxID=171281 RepID=A0A449B1T8_9BACT|nr:Adenine specific DNA methylase Mod [Mycoplasmopsis citelli]